VARLIRDVVAAEFDCHLAILPVAYPLRMISRVASMQRP
jgi:hypothetical protein